MVIIWKCTYDICVIEYHVTFAIHPFPQPCRQHPDYPRDISPEELIIHVVGTRHCLSFVFLVGICTWTCVCLQNQCKGASWLVRAKIRPTLCWDAIHASFLHPNTVRSLANRCQTALNTQKTRTSGCTVRVSAVIIYTNFTKFYCIQAK